jgi:hypothetical protein
LCLIHDGERNLVADPEDREEQQGEEIFIRSSGMVKTRGILPHGELPVQ